MSERVFYPLPDAAELARPHFRDALLLQPQIDNLRNAEQANGDGDQLHAVPEVKLTESVALNSGLLVQAHHGEHEPERSGRDAFGEIPTAQRSHEHDAEQG